MDLLHRRSRWAIVSRCHLHDGHQDGYERNERQEATNADGRVAPPAGTPLCKVPKPDGETSRRQEDCDYGRVSVLVADIRARATFPSLARVVVVVSQPAPKGGCSMYQRTKGGRSVHQTPIAQTLCQPGSEVLGSYPSDVGFNLSVLAGVKRRPGALPSSGSV